MIHIVNVNIIEILCKYKTVLNKIFLGGNLMHVVCLCLQIFSFLDSVVTMAKKDN